MKMLLRCLARIGAISRSTAWIASLVCDPARLKNTPPTFFSVWPLVSSASIVLAKVGASASSAMAAIEGGLVMLRRDALEGGKAERRGPLREKGIACESRV